MTIVHRTTPVKSELMSYLNKPVTGDNGCLTLYFAKLIYPLSASKKEQADHQRNIVHCHVFWHGSERLHAYDGYWKVRKTFNPPEREVHQVTIADSPKRRVNVQCNIIVSKNCVKEKECINLTYICGNLYNSQSTIGSIYPHLHAYQKRLKEDGELPALRIISWGPNDIFNESAQQYLPTFQEAGIITCCVLKRLRTIYNSPVHCHAHSLGATYALEALPRFQSPHDEAVPPVMCLDRGFTTLKAASWNAGYLSYASSPIAALLGFQSDTADALRRFFSTAEPDKPLPKITLLSARDKDHRMYGAADYCNSVALKTLDTNNKIRLLGFEVSNQELTHEHAAHSFPIHKFQYEHCTTRAGRYCFKKGENFADAFLREMLEEKREHKEKPKGTLSTLRHADSFH